MAFIDLPGDEDTPELARVTAQYRSQGRPVPSVIALMKHNPRGLRSVLQMNNALTFGGSSLGPRREEFIASCVSSFADCFY